MTFKVVVQFIEFASFVVAIIVMVKELGNVDKGQVSYEPLTGGRKTIVALLALVNPIVAGAIFYYGWRTRLPSKAKTANLFSFLGGLSIFCGLILYVLAMH
jgi:hypothetical protein